MIYLKTISSLFFHKMCSGKIVKLNCPTLRKGIMLSFAMAWRSRGAPVRDCRPAPTVEKKDPITMTHGDGHDRVPTTRFFWTASPNLKESADSVQSFFINQNISAFLLIYKRTSTGNIEDKSGCTQIHLLVSQDYSFNTRTKQNHRG